MKLIFTHTGYQCCYLYGSVPHNESNCVAEGSQLSLNFYIYNPHDNFTNMTVRWFRNGNMARSSSSNEEITDNQSEYMLFQDNASNPSLTIENINCSAGPLYRDIFILFINNFSSDKNGYYWCQIVVNNSISQPSQYAWFYAANSSSCTQQHHFKLDREPQCAYFVHNNQAHATAPEENISHTTTTFSEVTTTITTLKVSSTVTTSEVMSTLTTPEVTSTVTTPEVMSTVTTPEVTSTVTTPELATTQITESVTRSNVSITSILTALVVTLGTLVILMVLFYLYKCQKNKGE